MNKILITVRVPMIEKNYDVYISVSKRIGVTIALLVKTINELSEGHFPLKDDGILLSSTGIVYDVDSTVKDCGIKNSDVVILI